jgi:hypothetical protein
LAATSAAFEGIGPQNPAHPVKIGLAEFLQVVVPESQKEFHRRGGKNLPRAGEVSDYL